MDRAVVIEVSRLSKSYDGLKAVEDLSFQVYRGEIFGLLGPNGAGKSTTLRTLITLLHPTSGLARVLGHDTVKDADVATFRKSGQSIAFSPVVNTLNSSRPSITCGRTKVQNGSESCSSSLSLKLMPIVRPRPILVG